VCSHGTRRIVSDTRTMRHEIQSLKGDLSGHLRIGAIPTTLPFAPSLTVPFHECFPKVRLTVLSTTSVDILTSLENLEVDVGMSYIDECPEHQCAKSEPALANAISASGIRTGAARL